MRGLSVDGSGATGQTKLNEVLRLSARLGGFLDRKGDGAPGVKTISLGLKEMHVAAKTLRGLRSAGVAATCA